MKPLQLPKYWLPRQPMSSDSETLKICDRLIQKSIDAGPNTPIEYDLSIPRWQFLCHIAEKYHFALHGSGNKNFTVFEPRQSNDLNEFGNQKAVYAVADGIWPMFFAIVDRENYSMTVNNACIRVIGEDGLAGEPYYHFSLSKSALVFKPWRSGTIYILDGSSFTTQQPVKIGGNQIAIPQLAGFTNLVPLARLDITPADFPFLGNILGMEDTRIQEYAQAVSSGAPWPDELEI